MHALTLKVWLPRLLTPQRPHLLPLEPGCAELEQVSRCLQSVAQEKPQDATERSREGGPNQTGPDLNGPGLAEPGLEWQCVSTK